MSRGEPGRVETVRTPAGSFACEVQGPDDGPLVVCAHGFPDHPRTFRGIGRALAEAGFRVAAPWLRGYFPSPLDGPFDASRIGEDLAEIARALSPSRPAALVGHDWGAVASYEVLARRPDVFHRAVTLAVPHPTAFARNLRANPAQLRQSWYMAFLNLPVVSDRVVAHRDFAFVDRLWRAWSPGYVAESDYVRELKECLARSMPSPILYYRALARGLPASLRRRPPVIEVPTLYMHGEDDGCIGAELALGQERYFRGPFETSRVAKAGHFLHLEAPREVERDVVAWLLLHLRST
jgi:pimeloyl-ACP methyl ester carboxylesterase